MSYHSIKRIWSHGQLDKERTNLMNENLEDSRQIKVDKMNRIGEEVQSFNKEVKELKVCKISNTGIWI